MEVQNLDGAGGRLHCIVGIDWALGLIGISYRRRIETLDQYSEVFSFPFVF
jgi:hypothetical protein